MSLTIFEMGFVKWDIRSIWYNEDWDLPEFHQIIYNILERVS